MAQIHRSPHIPAANQAATSMDGAGLCAALQPEAAVGGPGHSARRGSAARNAAAGGHSHMHVHSLQSRSPVDVCKGLVLQQLVAAPVLHLHQLRAGWSAKHAAAGCQLQLLAGPATEKHAAVR